MLLPPIARSVNHSLNHLKFQASRKWLHCEYYCAPVGRLLRHHQNRVLSTCVRIVNHPTWQRKPYTSQSPEIADETDDVPVANIRNFCIVAHVDHGKSTLADRLLEATGTITGGNNQILDRLPVERERGITVKAQTATLSYHVDGQQYLLNLIDTPGHVDFASEVSRSLSACQGVVLLVDANQGVQAQTVANFYLAFCRELVIVPVLNKIDLPGAQPDVVKEQLHSLFGINFEDVLQVSAKLGTGVDEVLRAIVKRVPPPPVNRSAPFRALLFDSWYDRYRGAIALVYVTEGCVSVGDEIEAVSGGKPREVRSLGLLLPHEEPRKRLVAGQVGYMGTGARSAIIGDTLHLRGCPMEPLPGISPAQPMVFAGIYPVDQSQHPALRSAIERLTLNDSAVSVAVESSPALGQGWRLGFLGLLHLEVFSQRLEQEFDAETVVTAPSVTYKAIIIGAKNIQRLGGAEFSFSNPEHFPDPNIVSEFQEPMILGTIITPDDYLGSIMSLCMERRGIQKSSINIDEHRIMLQFVLPLNEIVVDFHDRLKSLTSGYASFDYEDHGYQPSKLVKLSICLNGTTVEELSTVVHASRATLMSRRIVLRLKETIPRQMFQIAIQAMVGGKVVARETLKAFRKDVTAKLYGGDVTRRMKLLRQQAEGKKKMKMIGNIALPRDTFISVLKR